MTYSDLDIQDALRREPSVCHNWIRVEPVEPWQFQPASIDLRLGADFVRFRSTAFVDMRDRVVPSYHENVGTNRDSYLELKSGELVLGTTIERVHLGRGVWASLEGKSSIGRMGLAVHVTAGFVDPGFVGQLTLELFNISPSPIRLRPTMPICQLAFGECVRPANRPYGSCGLGSRYQHQTGATPVRL